MYQIDLLRHGETTLSHTLRGSTDDALTELGWQQMHVTVDQSIQQHHISWDVIFSSPLQRCRLFAESMAVQRQLPLFLDASLQEMHFGDWEGISTAEIYAKAPELLAQFWEQPTVYTPPNAESLAHFKHRVGTALAHMQRTMHQHQFKSALVVTHGGVIKLLKCLAENQPLDKILSMSAELGQLNRFILSDERGIRLLEQQA